LLGTPPRSSIKRVVRLALAVAVALGVLLLLAGCVSVTPQPEHLTGNPAGPNGFPPPPATQQGLQVSDIYPLIFWVAVAVFVLVEGLLVIIVWRFRRRSSDDGLPTQTHGHNLLEVTWTLVPALIVTFLFWQTVNGLGQIQQMSSTPPPVQVDVTAFQWQWQFTYPNQQGISFTGSGQQGPVMVLPVGERVRITLQSKDVIHSFYVPQFDYKLDVIPGRTNEFEITIDTPGTYGGQCAEFCGLGHADMFFTVQAVSRPDFDAWVTQQEQAAQATPEPTPSGGQTITLNAVNFTTFNPPDLTAKANQPIVFDFHNVDTTQPHNVAIVGANADGTDWVANGVTQPGQTSTYTAPALPPGTYTFYCAVHPTTMRGTLTVTP
jgi:cytochrome c oxidase subunit 2